MLDRYLMAWKLRPDGAEIHTPRASLLPVLTEDGGPAMLKVASAASEATAYDLLEWWEGHGAVLVLARDGPAVLLERASDPTRLVRWYEEGRDAEAIDAIVAVASALHAPRATPVPRDYAPLAAWFAGLPAAAEHLGGVLHASAAAAADLLSSAGGSTVLHGDLHHENVLHFGERGWLAIDPKGVVGERAFEFVPQLMDPDDTNELDAKRLERTLGLTARAAGLDPARVRQWLLAWAGVQAVWWLEDGKSPEPSLRVAEAVAPGRVSSLGHH